MNTYPRLFFKSYRFTLFILLFSNYCTAQYNTNLGYKAGEDVTTGQKNVMVGEHAGETNNGTGNIFIGSQAGQNVAGSNLLIITNDTSKNTIYGDLVNQRIAIGTNEFPTDTTYRLAVEGKIIAREFKATQTTPWPDYVFSEMYHLITIDSLSEFIKKHNFLPGVPTAIEVKENGIELAAMNSILLKKIEELTLYLINQYQRLEQYKIEFNKINHELNSIKEVLKENKASEKIEK